MDDKDFPSKAATFLAQLDDDQRKRLVEMAQNFGSQKGGAQDRRRIAKDEVPRQPLHERFPNLKALRG